MKMDRREFTRSAALVGAETAANAALVIKDRFPQILKAN